MTREEMFESLLWKAEAELNNRAMDLEKKAKSMREVALDIRLTLDPSERS